MVQILIYVGIFVVGYYLGQFRGIILGAKDRQEIAYKMGYADAVQGRKENPDYDPIQKAKRMREGRLKKEGSV